MDNKSKRHGAFSWCELLTTEVTDAKHFYRTLFGWRLAPAPIPEVDYTLVKCDGEQTGGKILMGPQDIPKVGRFCVLKDPQGAMVNIITYAQGDA